MSETDAKIGTGDGSDARVPYEAPRFECEELFEVLALACGKTGNEGAVSCLTNPNMS